MDIKKIIYVLRAIGIPGIFRTIQYGFLRDRAEKLYRPTLSHTPKLNPGPIISSDSIPGGIRVKFENTNLELVFLTQNLIRLSWEPGKPPIPYTLAKTDWELPSVEIQDNRNEFALTSGHTNVNIDHTGGILFRDFIGNTIRQDNPPIKIGDGWQLSSSLKPEEHIYGLGERASKLNLRPGTYSSWNTDAEGSYSRGKDPLYIGTPIYLSLSDAGSYLIYYENSYRSLFNIGNTLEATFSSGMLRYYLIFGSLETIFIQLGELIGRPAMPPRWVLGYHQSRWGYRNEHDIREVARGFEEHNLPISAIHLDIDYMDGFRVFTFSPKRFKGIKQLSKDLNAKGIRLVASINPALKVDPNYEVYREGLSRDVFCKLPKGKVLHGVSWSGWSTFPDFSSLFVRKWWQEQYQALIENGISGIWHDMNEPSSFAAWGDKTLPTSTEHLLEGMDGDHREFHNLYGLLMNQAGYEGLRKFAPDRRPWILSRSGWTGLQRYAWNWTGDIETSWEALHQTIPTILGLGFSGHAFSGVDIGGFSGSPSAELYLRWFQLAAFLPFFRTHAAIGTKPREPWTFGEPYTTIIRNFLELHYKLIPYLYTVAWNSSQTGIPPIRPLFWENPRDSGLWDIEDEFLLGDSLLIAPILDENVKSRRITLPPGIWYSYWVDQKYSGGSIMEHPVSQETIPIFVKGGTLLPMEENGEICFHIFPGIEGTTSNQVYNDAGDGNGLWRVDTFHMTVKSSSMEITWEAVGEYPFPFEFIRLVIHGKSMSSAVVDGLTVPLTGNILITSKFQTINLTLS